MCQSACQRLSCTSPFSLLRIPGQGSGVWSRLPAHFTDEEVEALRGEVTWSPSGNLPCITHAKQEPIQCGGSGPRHPCCAAHLPVPLSDREPAAAWEQLHPRVQHPRQLHVQQWAVHPRCLAVRRAARLLRQERREGMP